VFLLILQGVEFELGAGLSAGTEQRLQQAVEFTQLLLSNPSVEQRQAQLRR